MAKNLRAKIPASDHMIIHDRNKDATASFVDEVGIARDNSTSNSGMGLMGIEIASSPRAVAEKSVGHLPSLQPSVLRVMSMFQPQ